MYWLTPCCKRHTRKKATEKMIDDVMGCWGLTHLVSCFYRIVSLKFTTGSSWPWGKRSDDVNAKLMVSCWWGHPIRWRHIDVTSRDRIIGVELWGVTDFACVSMVFPHNPIDFYFVFWHTTKRRENYARDRNLPPTNNLLTQKTSHIERLLDIRHDDAFEEGLRSNLFSI